MVVSFVRDFEGSSIIHLRPVALKRIRLVKYTSQGIAIWNPNTFPADCHYHIKPFHHTKHLAASWYILKRNKQLPPSELRHDDYRALARNQPKSSTISRCLTVLKTHHMS
jgi:hypothetical protein